MRVGDVIVNPFVKKDLKTKPNPLYQSMVIHIGKKYTTALRYDGKISKYYTNDIKNWEVLYHVNLYEIIYTNEIVKSDAR